MNDVAVVILNWNGRQFLELFLPIVVARSGDAKIWVVDNGSNDDSVNYLETNFKTVNLLKLDSNYGYTGGYNKALDAIEAKYYVLLNSDIEVCNGWLEPLYELMENDIEVAAVQPKILSFAEKNRFEYAGASGGFIDFLGYPFCRGRFIGTATEFDKGQYDDKREIFWATGAAFMVRGSYFKEIGGLDDNFFAHMEEIDLCWRLKRWGKKIMVEPKSVIFHVGGGTLPVWSPMKTYFNFRNNIAMLYKNLTGLRFFGVYIVRLGTDFLRFLSYVLTGKFKFSAAIFRGHRDFWRMRKKLDRQTHLPNQKVGQIYQWSIVLKQLFGKKTFGNMIALTLLFTLLSCGSADVATQKKSTQTEQTKVETVKVTEELPHSKDAYTQGLIYHNDKFYESTGEYGRSSVRIVDPASGRVEQSIKLDQKFFGEGLELVGDKLYQLTWMEQKGFIYDLKLNKIKEFDYKGEGWGLALGEDGLYFSDGSDVVCVLDPETFRVKRKIVIQDSKGSVSMINELEWIDGKLWANVYLTDKVAIIDPKNGKIEKYIDASSLLGRITNRAEADVLNGIAYDKKGNRIFLTGKNWDKVFVIENR